MLDGTGIEKVSFNLLGEADMKELFPINMLGGADTKKLNSRKNARRTGIEKASLTQYVRRGWRENLFSVKMLGEADIKKPFNLICWVGLAWKTFSH